MRKRNYIIIGILTLITLLAIGCIIILDGLSSMETQMEAGRRITLILLQLNL